MEMTMGTTLPGRDRIKNPKSDVGATKTTDITEFKKAFGDKGLDQVLNKISDPRYAAKAKRVKGVGNPELGKDAFFKLMLTQLQQQDPTNPMKSHEMAAQLAQFSSVEQLSHIKEAIEKNGQKEGHDQFQLLNLIGKVVSGDSSKVKRVPGDKNHNIEFKLPNGADTVNVKIKDSVGRLVKTYELSNMKAGKNQMVWNGLNDQDKEAPVGDYKAEIVATNGGKKMYVSTKFRGPVDGVQFSKKGPLLMVAGKTMALKDVNRIEVNKNNPAPTMAQMGMGAIPAGLGGRPPQALGQGMGALQAPKGGVMPTAHQASPKLAAIAGPQNQGYQPGQGAFLSPRNQGLPRTDVNKKYSKGAVEPRQVLANLGNENMNMDNALREKLLKR